MTASLLEVKAIEMKFAFFANRLVFPNKVTNERKKSCIMMVARNFCVFCCLEFTNFLMLKNLMVRWLKRFYELVMNLMIFLSMLHEGKGNDLEYYPQNYPPSKISTTKLHFNRQVCSPGIPPPPLPTLPKAQFLPH